jgi:L-alanine-DL-glutamate epimerase-like enolase superfamily enzyme
MKIERIRTYHLRAELTPAESFAYSQARVGFRTTMLVEIVADDGRSSLPPNPFALVPGELWFELDRTADPFREGLAAEPLKRAGAIIEVPQRPGLGLEVDRAVVERHAVTTGESRR